MIITGEKLNSSIAASAALIDAEDAQGVRALAQAQLDAGADYIDINAGTFLGSEAEKLVFLAKTVGAGLGAPVSVDTPSTGAARRALEAAGNVKKIINSVTLEPERFDGMSSLAREHGCAVVALCMQAAGDPAPQGVEGRLKAAGRLIEALAKKGVAETDIFIDPMLRPLGADGDSGREALETISRLRGLFPKCHISVGLSNLSFGLPKRRLINRAFAAAAMAHGLDAAIADPLDRGLMGVFAACDAILGNDEYCLDYIGKCREGLI
jgi:cobalamin-dependent methionine synthase I